MGSYSATVSAATTLRRRLEDDTDIVVCPGVYDGLTARIALHVGFDALYMTGSGTAMSRLGMPDIGLTTLNDMKDNAFLIANLDRSVPLIADADSGYGGPLMVGRTVAHYVRAGVAGMHLEDQVINKRCGHLRNKELVPEVEYLSRIRAAANMRAQLGDDIVIIARTDALQSLGFEVAVERLKKAIATGADVAFLEGIQTIEQARQVCKELCPAPVLYNMVQGGVSPRLTVAEAKEIGFRIIIYPSISTRAVFMGVTSAMDTLKTKGDFPDETDTIGPANVYTVCGLTAAMDFDKAAGSKTYNEGV